MKLPGRGKVSAPSVILLLLVVVVGAGLWWRGVPGRGSKIQTVLLISIDTCRADYLGCYGYAMDTTPHVDALAREAAVFENAISPVPFTLPAHCSMLTGTLPLHHQVMDNSDYVLGRDQTTLAETLKEHGFTTAAFVSSFILDSQFGLAQGFDVYDDDFEDEDDSMGIIERKGGETTDSALRWLAEHKQEKTFLFLHYYDPHFTYDPPQAFAEKFEGAPRLEHVTAKVSTELFGRYAGEIAFTDQCIGEVVARLKEWGMYDSTMIIVTSDHGEMLGQHGEVSHGFFVYQPAIQVPLIVRVPGRSKPIRITEPVGLIDLVPTICSAVAIEPDRDVQGVDLMDYFDRGFAGYPDRPQYCQSFEPTKYGANSLLGVLTDQYKYIQTTRPELYDLSEDPEELNNQSEDRVDRGRAMQDTLGEILENAGSGENGTEQAHLDDEAMRRLESLGYISGGIEKDYRFDSEKEDPKDLIDYHVEMMAAGYLVHSKKYAQAEQECRQLIAKRPSYFRPHFTLAKMASQQDKPAEAAAHLQKVLELKPDHVQSHQGLAASWEALGKPDDAIEQYVKLLGYRPSHVDGYYKLAKLLYERGDFALPETYRSQELLEHPSYVKAAITLAEKLLEKKQVPRACEDFRHILELEPASVEALNALAWIQGTTTRPEIRDPPAALRLALRACELTEYGEPESLDTLAAAYAAGGNFDQAIEISKQAILLANASEKQPMAARIGKRMALYEQQQPYRSDI